MIPALLAANLAGAVVVFVLVGFVLPRPEVDVRGTVLLVNLAAAGIYLLSAAAVGTARGSAAGAPRARGWSRTASRASPSGAAPCACRCASCRPDG